MSTEDQNRAVVTFHKGVDIDQAVNELLDAGYEMHDEKPGSRRNFDFVMTQEQAAALRNDPRIVDVRYGSKIENGIFPTRAVLEDSKTYSKTTTLNNTHYNWAHASCTSNTDRFTPTSNVGTQLATDIGFQYPYTLAGEGVDVVIQDSGIDPNHPEWLNRDGTASRLQQINWPNEAGLSGTYTQSANHYSDPDGHGTHVTGTAAGRLYGWAKDANIYSIAMIDNVDGFGTSASFNLIRGWHNNKGNNRPTVVNMSWGYFGTYTNITGGNYRGTPWTGTAMDANYGMVQSQQDGSGNWTHPVRVASVEADMQDCIDDGIILVSAAGNDSHKADISTGDDYNNYFTNNFGNRYYHQGSTPMGLPGVISVGNISYVYIDGQEPLFNSSTKGPRVDIQAPGGYIMSAIPDGSNIAVSVGTVDYPLDGNYKATKISGTSMASPQVCGAVACILSARPTMTGPEVLAFLQQHGTANRLYDSTTGTPSTDYSDFRALQGAENIYLQNPFNTANPFKLSGGSSIS